MNEIFTEKDWLSKPSKDQVAKEIAYFGRNFENDDIFKAIYFLSRGFTQNEIPELMMKAKIEQAKMLGAHEEVAKLYDKIIEEEDVKETTSELEEEFVRRLLTQSNVETQHSTSKPIPDD